MTKPAQKFESFDIDDEFQRFMLKCFPNVKEHEVQYKESRRIFSAGAAVMFMHVTGELAQLPEETALEELKKLDAQFEDFFKKRVGFTD